MLFRSPPANTRRPYGRRMRISKGWKACGILPKSNCRRTRSQCPPVVAWAVWVIWTIDRPSRLVSGRTEALRFRRAFFFEAPRKCGLAACGKRAATGRPGARRSRSTRHSGAGRNPVLIKCRLDVHGCTNAAGGMDADSSWSRPIRRGFCAPTAGYFDI